MPLAVADAYTQAKERSRPPRPGTPARRVALEMIAFVAVAAFSRARSRFLAIVLLAKFAGVPSELLARNARFKPARQFAMRRVGSLRVLLSRIVDGSIAATQNPI